jgi:hypothetical protein
MSYVDAGYVAAFGGLFLYAATLVWRRRRWERALRVADTTAVLPDGAGGPADGERS